MFFNKKTFLIFTLILSFIFTNKIEAYRGTTPKVDPLVYGNFIFSVDHKQIQKNDNKYFVAYVSKKDKYDKEVWKKEIYKILIDENLEEDVQWVFIKEIYIRDKKLVIINESDESFFVDISEDIIREIDEENDNNFDNSMLNLESDTSMSDKNTFEKFNYKIVSILFFVVIVLLALFVKFKFFRRT